MRRLPRALNLCFDPGMLSSGRLLLLHVVAQHGTLSGAARELGLSQPAVAQQIRRLEAEAGVALLIRSVAECA